MSVYDRPATAPVEAAPLARPRLKRLRLIAILLSLLLLRARLVRVRDVRLGRLGPAVADALLPVSQRAELAPVRRPRSPDRRLEPAQPRDRDAGGDPGDRQGGRGLDRGQALLLQQRHRRARNRARLPRRHPQQRRRPGRLDDRAAVHQERAPGAVAPHDLREAARGRAGLPALPQVVQGQDHHRLPEHDLLRQRRLRRRGGGGDVLRPRTPAPRLRYARSRALRPAAAAVGGRAAGRRDPVADGL